MRSPALLSFVRGQLAVAGWPDTVPLPPLLHRERDGSVVGLPRLRAAVRQRLHEAGVPFRDAVAPAPVRLSPPATPAPAVVELLASWNASGQGIAVGMPLAQRAQWVHLAAATCAAATLVVVADTGAQAAWVRALQPAVGDGAGVHGQDERPAIRIATATAAAWDMRWLGGRHELLVVDGLDLLPAAHCSACVDGSAALLRMGFATVADARLLHASAGLGTVLALRRQGDQHRTWELRLPLNRDERAGYESAWHEFFAAFDRFAALRPASGFGQFVRWARADAAARPGLLAWHRARQLAGWTEHKQRAVARLLARHRGQRIAVFTPDRDTAYAIARAHLVPAVTSALPAAERARELAAFGRGERRVLVGPRLLETGLDDGVAEVGILVGSCHGSAQRAARLGRVAPAGVVYELLSQDTMEVGRAARLRGTTAPTPAALDQ